MVILVLFEQEKVTSSFEVSVTLGRVSTLTGTKVLLSEGID